MSSPRPMHTRTLAQRLAEAEATIEALLSGQIDAVVDSKSKTPVLLAKAQEALCESEERYRRIVETSNEGIWTIDTEFKITFVNRRLIEMLGYPADEMLGQSLFKFLPESPGTSAVLRGEGSRAGISDESEGEFARKDGSKWWALLKTTPTRGADGTHVGTLGMMTDRTRHRQAEEALRKSEMQYRQIVETTSDGIVMLDLDAQLVFVNARFADMLGYEPREMIGLNAFSLMTAATKLHAAEPLQGRESEKNPAVDITFVHKNGDEVEVNIAGSPLVDNKGKRVGNIAVVRDVTERKKLQSQLMVNDRMASLGTLAAGVAHEINNPLAALLVDLEYVAESLSRTSDGDSIAVGLGRSAAWLLEEVVKPLDDARAAAERLRSIVRDLKMFSRSPGDESKSPPLDVNAVIDSSLRVAWSDIRHRARVVKRYCPVARAAVNEGRLGQVFLNLIVNASQSLEEGRAERNEIVVSTRIEGDRVVVEVSDTGAGIPPDDIGRIFDAFFTTKAVGVGTGLGLAICHRIVTDMGGELTVKSDVGKGTTFRVALPMAHQSDETRKTAAPIADAPVAGRRGRILLVDDEQLVVNALRRILSAEHDVTTTVAGKEALALCAAGEQYDVIFCDLMMPEMSGMELYGELRSVAPEQANKMVFLTGAAFTAKAKSFLAETRNEHLEKPFDPISLRAIARRHMQPSQPPGG